MKTSSSEKRRIFRMFASGRNPEQVVETLTEADPQDEQPDVYRLGEIERLYAEYLDLSLGEKQKITLMPDCVTDRLHRLMDDISDLTRVDALLEGADMKTIPPLLDIKRKIKERMAKEPALESRNDSEEYSDSERLIEEALNRVG